VRADEIGHHLPVKSMGGDIIGLLKAHPYFRGVSDDTLQEITRFAQVSDYAEGAVVHRLDQPLTSICFVVRGRLKAVRVDTRGEEHFHRMIERGEQYGIMLGSLGEALPVRVFALEDSTILSLDHEAAMELMFQHAALRRQWLRTYAGSLRRHFFEASYGRTSSTLAVLHESPATRTLAQKLIQRLQGLGQEICVLSDEDTWRSVPDIQFRSLSDGDKPLELTDIHRQIAEWQQANRIVFDLAAAQNQDWAARSMTADRILVFVRPREINSALQRLRSLDVTARGWRDKISIVWLLDEGANVAPVVPQLGDLSSRQFTISESRLSPPWGKVLSNGMERLVHHLRGVRIVVALGGGAARGMAHLGVLKALEESDIVVDVIAGTSAGAMTGAVYCAGLDCDYSASQSEAPMAVSEAPQRGLLVPAVQIPPRPVRSDAPKIPGRLEVGATAVALSDRKRRSGEWASRCSEPGRRGPRSAREHQLAGAFQTDLQERPGAG
jgi:CRP-like cAMP-binding protein